MGSRYRSTNRFRALRTLALLLIDPSLLVDRGDGEARADQADHRRDEDQRADQMEGEQQGEQQRHLGLELHREEDEVYYVRRQRQAGEQHGLGGGMDGARNGFL